MKKLLYLFIAGSMLTVACKDDSSKEDPTPAPTPTPAVAVVKENTALLQKFSGTRCGPCGSWGWEMSDELIAYGEGKALYMGTFSENFVAQGFITTEATTMDKKWGVTGYPTFSVNGKLELSRTSSGVNTTQEKQMCKDDMDEFSSDLVTANTGVKYTVADGKMLISASVKFFEKAQGDYNVAFYIVEDKAMWAQSGNTASNGTTPIPHHYVLRGSTNGTWGESVFSGTIEADAFKDVTSEMVVNPAWNMDNIDVYAVIWKKTGSDSYKFVNVSHVK